MIDANQKIDQIVQKYQLEDKVAFIYDVTEQMKNQLLDRCQVLMVTGKNQGFSLLQVEAMARGIILVASNSGGSLETIVHEYTGFLLPKSSDLWAQKLNQIICEDHSQMSQNARERVKRLFSMSIFADSLE